MAAHWLLQKAGRQRHRKCSRFRALSIVFVFAIRGAMPDSPNPPPETSESSRSRGELYQTLRTRCRDLEMSHRKLQEQFETLLKEKEKDRLAEEEEERRTVWKGDGENIKRGCIPGFFVNSAYWHVLQSMGHALHISRACTGEIIYWNQAAENLYGWKDYEVLGQRAADLLINEENRVFDKKITEDLNGGQSWSGQFPLRKRSGEVFMAMVTKSLLYEDGKCIGVITVSSDAAVFNQINFEILRTRREHAYGQPREWRLSMKKIQWHSKPQIASSVSNLVSKVFSRRRGESGCKIENAERREMMQQTEAVQAKKDEIQASNPSFGFNVQKKTTEANSHRKEETVSELSQPSKIAAKVLPKFFVGTDNNTQEHCKNNQLDSSNVSGINHMKRAQGQVNEDNSRNGASRAPKPPTRGRYSDGDDGRNQKTFAEDSSAVYKNSLFPSLGCSECYAMQKFGDWLPPLLSEQNRNEQTQHYPDSQHEVLLEKSQNPDSKLSSTVSSSGGSVGSSHSSSTKGEKGPNSLVDCEIHWEDLVLGEEIGQGSSGIVYRGIWNGSDVAIKVYMGCEYREGIFLDYKKEIAIMKRLRHPNVLLFMGAVYSPDRLAIVTEFLPRGSLFKVLHKNNQALDLKRRLRMALDVVRGMNYLHCRNPPIVHRDLKSSNLLVDRKWTVKVGDFGLSCLKNSAFLTPKSGRGTPQWMAPEVLRNEPSNEKSDVFSFGVILWELMTESVPWSHLNALQVVGVVGYMDRRLDLPEGLDPRIASIIRDCWLSEPEKRPAFEHILQRVGDVISTVVVATSRKNKDPQF